jgi:hypothetical protein
MRHVLLVSLAVAALALPVATASGAATSPQLTWRGGHYQGYRLLLPANWRYRNASYPSDHSTYLYWDPANALRKLIVVASGCVGCVSKNLDPNRPDPSGMLPDWASSTYRISPWKLAFSGYTNDDPYPANGLIVVNKYQGQVSGSMIAELWLPKSQHSLATTILNSFSTSL